MVNNLTIPIDITDLDTAILVEVLRDEPRGVTVIIPKEPELW